MMRVALDEGWAVVVLEHGYRFNVRVWDRDRTQYVDAVHGTFGCALREAVRLAFAAQDRAEPMPLGRSPSPSGGRQEPEPARQEREQETVVPSPAQLAAAMATVCEVVA